MRSARALATSLVIAAAACGGELDGHDDAANGDGEFIAFERDFKGFTAWRSTDFGVVVDASAHQSGRRVAYVNRGLAPGATVAPRGTIIVKISGIDTPTRRVFAMAKRGGTYNREGAKGWEWFELEDGTDAPRIVWRGLGPPDGETYAGGTECNTCHVAGEATDYVLGPELLR